MIILRLSGVLLAVAAAGLFAAAARGQAENPPGEPPPPAEQAAAAVPPPLAAPSAQQFSERRRRYAAIKEMGAEELDAALAKTVVLDAERGLPLLREQALCRVAIQRTQWDIDDYASIPEVRRAAETFRRPEIRQKLLALAKLPPADMLNAFLALLDQQRIRLDDLALLGRLIDSQQKLAEYRQWAAEIEQRLNDEVERAKKERSADFTASGPTAAIHDQVDDRRKMLQEQHGPAPPAPPGVPGPEEASRLREIIERLAR